MSAEPTITAEQVMQTAAVRAGIAERIAAYANHRAAGLRPTDAQREVGVTDKTAGRYERVMRELRAALGLPPLATYSPPRGESAERLAAATKSSTHSRWHVARGVTKPGCELCSEVTDG